MELGKEQLGIKTIAQSKSSVGLPSWQCLTSQADLRAGKGPLLKGTFDFSLLTHLLQQASRHSYGTGTLPMWGHL